MAHGARSHLWGYPWGYGWSVPTASHVPQTWARGYFRGAAALHAALGHGMPRGMCLGITSHHRFWETDSGASPGDISMGMGMGIGMCGRSKARSADAKWVSLCPGEHRMHKEGWTKPHQHPQFPTVAPGDMPCVTRDGTSQYLQAWSASTSQASMRWGRWRSCTSTPASLP